MRLSITSLNINKLSFSSSTFKDQLSLTNYNQKTRVMFQFLQKEKTQRGVTEHTVQTFLRKKYI